MNTQRHNHRTDLSFIETFYKVDSLSNFVVDKIPDNEIDFEFIYSTGDDRTFSAGRKKGVYFNCERLSDSSIIAYIPLSREYLGTGELIHNLQLYTPSKNFPAGVQQVSIPRKTGIHLWIGPSDATTLQTEGMALMMQLLKGAPGISPKITELENTENSYRLCIQTESGTIETPNLRTAVNILQSTGTNTGAAMSQAATTQEFEKKVDKEDGKGLSAEDFTTILKTKLESLHNFDDTELTAAITAVQNRLNTLLNGNVNGVIDAFNEIEKFLAGITDIQTLIGMLADIQREITQKIPAKVSQLENDSAFMTRSLVQGLCDEQYEQKGTAGDLLEQLFGTTVVIDGCSGVLEDTHVDQLGFKWYNTPYIQNESATAYISTPYKSPKLTPGATKVIGNKTYCYYNAEALLQIITDISLLNPNLGLVDALLYKATLGIAGRKMYQIGVDQSGNEKESELLITEYPALGYFNGEWIDEDVLITVVSSIEGLSLEFNLRSTQEQITPSAGMYFPLKLLKVVI